MFITFGFVMDSVQEGTSHDYPLFCAGDIAKLKRLFPDNPIWEARTSDVGNIYYPTEEQARAFYDALKAHVEMNEVSDEEYVTGNITGSFPATSTLKSAFENLIAFFEVELDNLGVV